MNKLVLITANGDGTRMRNFFRMPKHLLYYKGKRIIDTIVESCKLAKLPYKIASKHYSGKDYFLCTGTRTRMETIRQCVKHVKDIDTIIIHDCDIIFPSEHLASISGNTISVSLYKGDGLKYGFVSVDEKLEYKIGNEKESQSEFITTGVYACDFKSFKEFLIQNPNAESMLEYYNHNKPKLLYVDTYINLGDIESYMNNL